MRPITEQDQAHLNREGYLLLKNIVSAEKISALLSELPDGSAGLRKALQWSTVAALSSENLMMKLVEDLAGQRLIPVRGLLFDKSPDANWSVGWHQDLALALCEKKEVEGFGPWSVKAGIPHAHGPNWLLAQMLTLRIHLDSCTEQDGPLCVVPRSHQQGRLNSDLTQSAATRHSVTCVAEVGDILVMRPLLLHASHSATTPSRRRILHLEYGPETLPGGLQWSRS